MAQTIEEAGVAISERLACHLIMPDEIEEVVQEWETDPRWKGIERP